MVIGNYLRTAEAAEARAYRGYEEFAYNARFAFKLEDWALFYSTYALGAAVAGYGVYQLVDGSTFGVPFVLSGAIGAVGEFVGGRHYARRRRALDALIPHPAGDGA
jgi:hypothetical protein